MKYILTLLLCTTTQYLLAQSEPPIATGQWRSHFSHKASNCATLGKDGEVWVGEPTGLSHYIAEYNSVETMDRIDGLADLGVTQLVYDEGTDETYVFYTSSNIDVIHKSDILNLPYISNSSVVGDKQIKEARDYQDFIYLSTGIGIIVLDKNRKEIKETYNILAAGSPDVLSSCILRDTLFASTSEGLYVGSLQDNLSNYSNWSRAVNTASPKLAVYDQSVYYYDDEYVIRYGAQGIDTPHTIDIDYRVQDAYATSDALYFIASNSDHQSIIYKIQNNTLTTVPVDKPIFIPNQLLVTETGVIYVSDFWQGLCEIDDGKLTTKRAAGPETNSFYDLYFSGHTLYAPSGGVDLAYNGISRRDGLKIFRDDSWSNISERDHPELFDLTDMMTVSRDPATGSVYVGSWGGGLLEIKEDGSLEIYKDGYFTMLFNSARITGSVMDADRNLWMTNYGGSGMKGLNCKKADGEFVNFNYNKGLGLGPIEIDQAGQLWMIEPRSGGVHCYDPAGTIDDFGDDRTSSSVSGLSGTATCMEVTQDGELWIGTDNGISIIPCPESYIDGNCEVELRVVNYDGVINGYLFSDQIINSICVDGANRKWIGTENGAWLITEDAENIVLNFDKTKSPLPSNAVKRIAVNPDNGEVFFVTNEGLLSYRGDATQGIDESKNDLLVFPNPVKPGYQGNIAIRGVSTNARVKITDAKGQLVYETVAQGGQANWNGYTYTGKKAHSGVYYVYALSPDGMLRNSTKLVLIE